VLVFFKGGTSNLLDLYGIDHTTAFGFFGDQETEGGIAAEIEIDEVVIVNDEHRVCARLFNLLTQDAKRLSASGDFSFIILIFRRSREQLQMRVRSGDGTDKWHVFFFRVVEGAVQKLNRSAPILKL
jgi:hypothetical protein